MSLYVRAAGEPTAEAIVFLHGGGLSSAQWLLQFADLSDYHCLAPDLPEQGKSAEIGPFTLRDAASRVAELIQTQTSQGKAHIVGLSAGGAVALRVLRDTPEVVDHLLVSGTAGPLSPFLAHLNDLNEPVMRWLSPEQLTNLLMKSAHISQKYRDLIFEGMSTCKPAFIRHFDHELTKIKLPEHIEIPLLVMVGEKEPFLEKRFARQLVQTLEGAEGVIIPDVGHLWNLQDPELFSAIVRAWITDAPLPARLIKI